MPEEGGNETPETSRAKRILIEAACELRAIANLQVNDPVIRDLIQCRDKLETLREQRTKEVLAAASGPSILAEPPTTLGAPQSKDQTPFVPVARFTAQENLILDTIRALGYDPLALPMRRPGKATIKAVVRAKLESRRGGLFIEGGSQFKHAWDRLRANGKLKELE